VEGVVELNIDRENMDQENMDHHHHHQLKKEDSKMLHKD